MNRHSTHSETRCVPTSPELEGTSECSDGCSLGSLLCLFYRRVYDLLFSKKTLMKYSPEDALPHLSLISEMKVGASRMLSKISKQSIGC